MASIGNLSNREIEITGTARYPGLRFKQQPKKNRSTELDDVLTEYENQEPESKISFRWITQVLMVAVICLLFYICKKQQRVIERQNQYIETTDSLLNEILKQPNRGN